MKIMNNFRYERKPSCAITKSTLFAIGKDEWCILEDFGNFLKNALCILWYTSRIEVNIEKIKPEALAIVELCLTEHIR